MPDFNQILTDFETAIEPRIVLFVDTILPTVSLMAGVIATVFIAYKVFLGMSSEDDKINAKSLLRPCLVLGALVLYQPLVELFIVDLVGIVDGIVEDGARAASGGSTPGDLKGMRDKMIYTQDTGGGPDNDGIHGVIQINPLFEFIHMLIFFAASVAGGYILLRQLVLKSIYFMIGPFAIAFSLILGNEKVINSWYQGFVSILLWLPMLNIVKTIILIMPVETSNFDAEDILFSVALQVMMVFAVFKVPQYANMLVAQGSSMGQQLGEGIKSHAISRYQTNKQASANKKREQ